MKAEIEVPGRETESTVTIETEGERQREKRRGGEVESRPDTQGRMDP